jgi:hypothetical protein
MKGKIKPEDADSLRAISEVKENCDEDSFGSLIEEDSSDDSEGQETNGKAKHKKEEVKQ